ncbi:MAG: acyl dehydratase [Geminicoccaceae bacterium]|jgi:acyl dehydratase|nr:MAG: acyl dehydratase [Geminicoccaceae bacterium]
MGDLWLEDFTVGRVFTTRGCTLSEAQILDFAWQHDPQPFHIDVVAAAESPYGGIIASGFQTLLVAFRLFYQEKVINAASMGSPGMDEVRWVAPVRPGDTIRVRAEVLDVRPSRSRPDRGTALLAYTVTNQRDETVMTFKCHHILRRRPETTAT